MRIGRRLAVVALLLAAASSGEAATVIGAVGRLQGGCEGVSEGATRTLAAGAPVHLDETVSTGAGARRELTFEDGTVLTLGEKARVTVDRFVYRPRATGNAFRATTIGAFRFVSGQLHKTAGSTAEVATPVATIAIRGTDFWGGPIDGQYGVFLTEGAVSVRSGGRETVLNGPGQGVTLSVAPRLRGGAAGAAPVAGPVTVWPQARVDRAFAAVTFN